MNKDRRVKRTMSIVEIAPTLETKSLKGSGETAEVIGKEGRILRKELKKDVKELAKQKSKGKYHNPNFLTKNWWKLLLGGGALVGGYVVYNKIGKPLVGTAQAIEGVAGLPLQAISGINNFLGSVMQGLKPEAFDITKIFGFPKATEKEKFQGLNVLTKGLSEGFRDLSGMFPDISLVGKAAANVKTDYKSFAFPVTDLIKNVTTLKQPFKITEKRKTDITAIVKPKARSESANNLIAGVTNLFTKSAETKPVIEFNKIPLFNFVK
jgi:hypothetical protein